MIKFKCLHMYVCVVLYVFIKSLDFPKGTKNTDNSGEIRGITDHPNCMFVCNILLSVAHVNYSEILFFSVSCVCFNLENISLLREEALASTIINRK